MHLRDDLVEAHRLRTRCAPAEDRENGVAIEWAKHTYRPLCLRGVKS
jgi:hypothetical protein